MTKMKASDLSANALSVLTYLQDNEWRSVRDFLTINELSKLSVTTIRRMMTRLVIYGLVAENESEGKNPHRLFRITRDGKDLLKQATGITQDKPVTKTEPRKPVKSINQEIKERQPNIVSWLRHQAEAFNRMANDLEAYED